MDKEYNPSYQGDFGGKMMYVKILTHAPFPLCIYNVWALRTSGCINLSCGCMYRIIWIRYKYCQPLLCCLWEIDGILDEICQGYSQDDSAQALV